MSKIIQKKGRVGKAVFTTTLDPATGAASVHVQRAYPAGKGRTADLVWQIVSDFGGVKTLFPTLLSVYNTYADNTASQLNMIRVMSYAPPDAQKPLSSTNPLAGGIEQLVAFDAVKRYLTYTSLSGLPLKNYRSVMQVSGKNACTLDWTSTFEVDPKDSGQVGFISVLVSILAGGANQVATALSS